MKHSVIAAIAALGILGAGAATSQAHAKGCIKGAILGGIAGHYAGHGVLGAVGGCAAGRALANRQARQPVAPPTRNYGNRGGYGTPVNPNRGAGGYVAY